MKDPNWIYDTYKDSDGLYISLDGTKVEEAIEELQKALKDPNWKELEITLDYFDPYSQDKGIQVKGYREMTDKEKEAKRKEEEQKEKNREEYERKLFEQLNAKYGKK